MSDFTPPPNPITDFSYSWMPGNIYHEAIYGSGGGGGGDVPTWLVVVILVLVVGVVGFLWWTW